MGAEKKKRSPVRPASSLEGGLLAFRLLSQASLPCDGPRMRVARGRVSGRVVILEEELPDGAEVDVRLRSEGDDGVEVTDAEWAALMEAAESVRQGKTVDAQTVLAALARRR